VEVVEYGMFDFQFWMCSFGLGAWVGMKERGGREETREVHADYNNVGWVIRAKVSTEGLKEMREQGGWGKKQCTAYGAFDA
jgi:hypothetical protein